MVCSQNSRKDFFLVAGCSGAYQYGKESKDRNLLVTCLFAVEMLLARKNQDAKQDRSRGPAVCPLAKKLLIRASSGTGVSFT